MPDFRANNRYMYRYSHPLLQNTSAHTFLKEHCPSIIQSILHTSFSACSSLPPLLSKASNSRVHSNFPADSPASPAGKRSHLNEHMADVDKKS